MMNGSKLQRDAWLRDAQPLVGSPIVMFHGPPTPHPEDATYYRIKAKIQRRSATGVPQNYIQYFEAHGLTFPTDLRTSGTAALTEWRYTESRLEQS